VIVENYIPGTLKKYGLDYQTLSVRKPALIYASITGTSIETLLIQDMVRRDHMLYERAMM
jgi:CoA-transferase family III